MFENLTRRLEEALSIFRGRRRLSEKDLDEGLRQVRMALLEADVNYKVARDFVQRVRERGLGEEIAPGLDASQHVIKIVHEELVRLLGEDASDIREAEKPPTVIMLCGLQGGGKTTTAGKLARMLKERGRRPLLVATDIHRPAAIKQLQVVGEQVGVPVFQMGEEPSAADIGRAAVAYAREQGHDFVIVDTAGRLHTDAEMMFEISTLADAVDPTETLLVLDAQTGQDAVNVAQQFCQSLHIDGVILTKLDGDARGGAALSLRAVTGKPIKWAGVGEKLDALEPFHPDRMASRILGMGDVLTLIERAQAQVDQQEALELQRKIVEDRFTLEDFLKQLRQVRRLGPLQQLLELLPKGWLGPQANILTQEGMDPKEIDRIEAIICSMTPEERQNPHILSPSRKRRIARGSGTSVAEVNAVIKQFGEMQRVMRTMMMGVDPGTALLAARAPKKKKRQKRKRGRVRSKR